VIARAVVVGVCAAALGGCSACGSDHGDQSDGGVDAPTFDQCKGDAASFVRQAFLALDGRRPKSQAEVDAYVDLYTQAEAASLDPKDTVARAIMGRPEFAERWVDVVMDAMHVQRYDIQTEVACWDKGMRSTDASLATAVRDQPATATVAGGAWTMIDLARSALVLDDLSPIYRAQMFSMVSHPIPAANVGRVEAELSRRADFGATFDSAFLHRDVVCLGCHNSERSVTDNDDPALDRFWPVIGLAERALYGNSMGVAEERAHAAFRVDNFVGVNGQHARPWGWSASCGEFVPPAQVGTDVAGVDAKLASVTGQRATVYDLEAALGRGFAALRGHAPVLATDGSIADPDTALAWLVVLKITEDTWKQATGTSLTIANYFPRNQAASDLLTSLATTFTTSGFSLKALLVAIVASDYFDRKPAELGCGASPYTYPNVYDPWVIADPDPAKRHNGPGDAVTAVDPRTLVTATNLALDWTAPPAASRFPDYGEGCDDLQCSQLSSYCLGAGQCCDSYQAACQMNGVLPAIEVPFQRGVGMFLRNSERGFRGLDFQARLVWENRYGACTKPKWVTSDFVDKLVAAGAADASAKVSDVVLALKDRLIGEPSLPDQAEMTALAAIVGALDGPASGVTPATARQVCGALVESPQFLLQGIAGHGGERPKLTPMEAGYDAVCGELAMRGAAGHTVTCDGGKLTLH
jgi:hypothetical protein